MKQRIISGAVMGGIVALVLVLGLWVKSVILTTFVALIAALGVFELVGNAAKIDNIVFRIVSAVYTVIMVFLFCGMNENLYKLNLTNYEYFEISSTAFAFTSSFVRVLSG